MIIIPNTISNRGDQLPFTKQSFFNKKQFTEVSIVDQEQTVYKSFETSEMSQVDPQLNLHVEESQIETDLENSESDFDSRAKVNLDMKTYENPVLRSGENFGFLG